jgi:hypothetical protein
MSRDTAGILPKQGLVIPPVTGTVEHTEVTDEGVRYIGRTHNGYYVSVDITDKEMIASVRGLIILIEGEFLERSESYYKIYNKVENTYAEFSVGPGDKFRLTYEIIA